MKKELTYDEFDALCDRLENAKFKCSAWGDWWPTVEEIKSFIEPNIKDKLEFALWIVSTANPPKTDSEKASRTYLNQLINKNLNLYEKKG